MDTQKATRRKGINALRVGRIESETHTALDWRGFQDELRTHTKRYRQKKIGVLLLILVLTVIPLVLLFGGFMRGGERRSVGFESTPHLEAATVTETPPHRSETPRSTEMPRMGRKHTTSSSQAIPQSTMKELLAEIRHRLEAGASLNVVIDDRPCRVSVSLDEKTQTWMEARLAQSMALGGVSVLMDPHTGRVRALATFNKDQGRKEAFFWKTYPAASLFKIVTAAAAVDLGRLTPESSLSYNGHPYTLYRNNLSTTVNRWTKRVTLTEAFAKSLNPVFGKIGVYEVGPEFLDKYGSDFLFNHSLPTEIPLDISRLEIPHDQMGIAEIASGLNQTTTISPVHAAWLASVIFNGGAAPMPWLVERIEDHSGTLLYEHSSNHPFRAISSSSARKVRTMMKATISEGTCKRKFAGKNQDSILKSIEIGGKTGNVNNEEDTRKYDWFIGYGHDPDTGKKIVLSVLLIHGQHIGQRANRVAYDIFRNYFK